MQLLCTPTLPASLVMARPDDWILTALDRAQVAAQDVAGNYAAPPWRFVAVGESTAQALTRLHVRYVERQRGDEAARKAHEALSATPGWIVVTCAQVEDPAEAEHVLERSLTAVQRFALSLWAEDLHTRWAQPPFKDDPALADLLGLDTAAEFVIGVLWYAADASQLPPASDMQIV